MNTLLDHDLTAAAVRLAADADERAEELDAACRLPDDLHEAAARLGLFRQLVPVPLGGRGDDPAAWFRLGLELGRHDASFAWVVTQGAVELGWIAAGGDPDWAAWVLADPLSASASTTAGLGTLRVPDDGGDGELTGRWAFDTGCDGATWIGGLALVDGGPLTGTLRMCWVPAPWASIERDWDAVGLRGTGSHSVRIDRAAVPASWTVAIFDPATGGRGRGRGPHASLVGNGNWPIAASVAAVQLGNARRALDEVVGLLATKAPAPAYQVLATVGAVQRQVLRLEGRWLAAATAVERELGLLWDDAIADGALGADRRWRVAAVHHDACRAALEVVDGCVELAGTAVAPRRGRLARCLRDAHTLRGHIALSGDALERGGAARLGVVPPDLLV